jgi:hypothetical protein
MATTTKKSKRKGGSASWAAPAAVGVGLAFGIGLVARKARAKSTKAETRDRPEPSNADDASKTAKIDVRFPVYEGQDGAYMLQELLDAAGLDSNWKRFFLVTARGESGFVSNVALGDPHLYPVGSTPSKYTATLGPGEAAGARQAYERARDKGRLDGCPWPGEAYSWGSGGWLGMLPANAWYAYKDTSLRCRHPWYLLHPVDHVVVAIDFARRLMRWSNFKADPTWLTLRVGWGNPSNMNDAKARARVEQKFGDQLRALGASPQWMHNEVTALPKYDVEDLWDTLMREFDFEPGRRGA